MTLTEKLADALVHAARYLDEDVLERIHWALDQERALADASVGSRASSAVLEAILANLQEADKQGLPMCQDTGMFLVFVDIGRACPLGLGAVERAVLDGCAAAVDRASFRRSVVEEPVYDRANTGRNLPPVIWWNVVAGDGLEIQVLLKGFGSENCSSVRMLNPTGGEQAVIQAVQEIVRNAGGKPCPPIFVGVGLGGTMDRASYLSKRALLRDVRISNPDQRYAQLEESITEQLQHLSIGSGGLGGAITALHVAVEQESTHIAGLPLAVSINCWADRKAHVVWEGEDA
ncbi:MAG: fumarate hydratase [Sphaerochaeta sp.]|uniref:fumarate hydratase n=1 Tax=Sphaerochaeta sp. TaxID=1972642 RepID=UPI003D0F3165